MLYSVSYQYTDSTERYRVYDLDREQAEAVARMFRNREYRSFGYRKVRIEPNIPLPESE